MSLFAGVDLGGTHMQVGVVDDSGSLVGRAAGMTDAAAGFETICGSIADRVREACAGAAVGVDELGAVGLAAPGAVDPATGVVVNAPNLGWHGEPAAERLRGLLGVPVQLDNDVNAAVLAEQRLGAGRGHADLFGVWIGTGVGGGLVLGGWVYHGAAFSAGEIGHTIVDEDTAGTAIELEAVASRTAIAAAVERRVRAGQASVLAEAVRGGERLTAAMLADAADRGDAAVLGVLGGAARTLGDSIATVVTLLSIRRVVLGGGLVETLGARLCDPVQARVRERVWPGSLRGVEVCATQLGPDAGLLGAAMLARERTRS